MTKWINTERLPVPTNAPSLVIWRGTISLAEWDAEENCFYLSNYPAVYRESLKVPMPYNLVITHWMQLPKLSEVSDD